MGDVVEDRINLLPRKRPLEVSVGGVLAMGKWGGRVGCHCSVSISGIIVANGRTGTGIAAGRD